MAKRWVNGGDGSGEWVDDVTGQPWQDAPPPVAPPLTSSPNASTPKSASPDDQEIIMSQLRALWDRKTANGTYTPEGVTASGMPDYDPGYSRAPPSFTRSPQSMNWAQKAQAPETNALLGKYNDTAARVAALRRQGGPGGTPQQPPAPVTPPVAPPPVAPPPSAPPPSAPPPAVEPPPSAPPPVTEPPPSAPPPVTEPPVAEPPVVEPPGRWVNGGDGSGEWVNDPPSVEPPADPVLPISNKGPPETLGRHNQGFYVDDDSEPLASAIPVPSAVDRLPASIMIDALRQPTVEPPPSAPPSVVSPPAAEPPVAGLAAAEPPVPPAQVWVNGSDGSGEYVDDSDGPIRRRWVSGGDGSGEYVDVAPPAAEPFDQLSALIDALRQPAVAPQIEAPVAPQIAAPVVPRFGGSGNRGSRTYQL